MISIRIWGIADEIDGKLRALHKKIVESAAGVPKFDAKHQEDITIYFPADQSVVMRKREKKIVIEFGGLIDYSHTACTGFAEAVGKSVREAYPYARVDCHMINPGHEWVIWSSTSCSSKEA